MDTKIKTIKNLIIKVVEAFLNAVKIYSKKLISLQNEVIEFNKQIEKEYTKDVKDKK